MVLCSAVRLFRRARKDATLGEVISFFPSYITCCENKSITLPLFGDSVSFVPVKEIEGIYFR